MLVNQWYSLRRLICQARAFYADLFCKTHRISPDPLISPQSICNSATVNDAKFTFISKNPPKHSINLNVGKSFEYLCFVCCGSLQGDVCPQKSLPQGRPATEHLLSHRTLNILQPQQGCVYNLHGQKYLQNLNSWWMPAKQSEQWKMHIKDHKHMESSAQHKYWRSTQVCCQGRFESQQQNFFLAYIINFDSFLLAWDLVHSECITSSFCLLVFSSVK